MRWIRHLIANIGGVILASERLYRLKLKTQGYGSPVGRPRPEKWNAVLQSTDEYESAIDHLRVLGLPIHSDPPKNWDNLIAMDAILRSTGPTAHILDGGAELYSSMLPSLLLFGYRNLYGINLSFDRSFRRGPIRYSHGDITHTEFPAESFHAITCLSVIEHGVDPEA